MPVVRNPQYYFKEGFCWSDINTTYLKCRIKGKSINDVKSMSLYGLVDEIPEYYIVSLINSTFISLYVDNFVNNTQTFQINDARQLPIVFPATSTLMHINKIFNEAISIKKEELNNTNIGIAEADYNLTSLQRELDNEVNQLYGVIIVK